MSSTEKEVLLSDAETAKPAEVAKPAEPTTQTLPNGGVVVVRRQDQFSALFGPMLDELEQAVNSNMAELDKLEETFMGESKRKKAEEQLAHIPREIRTPRPINAVMHNLECLLLDLPIEEQPEEAATNGGDQQASAFVEREPAIHHSTSKLGSVNQIACMAHSLSAYLVTTDSRKHGEHIKNVTSKLYDDVNLWLAHLFRFNNSSVLFHDQESDGLIRMCNMLFHIKYKNFARDGFTAIKKPPTIYISASSKYAIADYKDLIAVQLGIPTTCIRLAKVHKALDSQLDKIDLYALMSQIDDDIAAGHAPLAIVANAGSYATGQCDNIEQLNHICYKYRMWLHLEGIYLSSLVQFSVPTAIQPVSSGDSITLNLASWLGIPSLSYVTMYKNVEDSSKFIQPFNSAYNTLHKCLPYWCVLQVIGHGGVMERIKYPTEISTFFRNTVSKYKPFLRVLNFKEQNPRAAAQPQNITGFSGLIAKALSYLTFVDLTQPIVIFKCDQAYVQQRLFLLADKFEKTGPTTEPLKAEFMNLIQDADYLKAKKKPSDEPEPEPEATPRSKFTDEINEYTDTITTWLCDLLNSLHKNVELELVEIQDEGTCIRYSPIEHANILATDETDLAAFSKSMDDMIKILDSSIKCKSTFESDMKQFKNLLPVNVPKWAGVGAVRYMPDYLSDKADAIMQYQEAKLKAKKQAEEAEKAKKAAEEAAKEAEAEKSAAEETEAAEADQAETPKAEETAVTPKPEEASQTESSKPENQEAASFVADETLEKHIKEINNINEQLVKKLQAQDGAFSLGEAGDGMLAVKFGMINESDALKNLALQVQDAGHDVEESSRFIETMSELVRQGIEKATEDLKKAKEEKLAQQQSLLNNIPIVGSLMSWFTSAPVEPKAGRTFNLQSGKIASTELTHKYRMQVEESDELKDQVSNGNSTEEADADSVAESINAEQVKNKLISNHIVNSQRAGRRLSTESARSTVSSVGINVNGVVTNGND